MENRLYDDVFKFLNSGTLPNEFSSTKSNFIRTARKYKINKKGFLTRNGKPVISADNQAGAFLALHDHSGRTACWLRIRTR